MERYNWQENANGKLVHGEWMQIGDETWFIEDEEPYVEPDRDLMLDEAYEW